MTALKVFVSRDRLSSVVLPMQELRSAHWQIMNKIDIGRIRQAGFAARQRLYLLLPGARDARLCTFDCVHKRHGMSCWAVVAGLPSPGMIPVYLLYWFSCRLVVLTGPNGEHVQVCFRDAGRH